MTSSIKTANQGLRNSRKSSMIQSLPTLPKSWTRLKRNLMKNSMPNWMKRLLKQSMNQWKITSSKNLKESTRKLKKSINLMMKISKDSLKKKIKWKTIMTPNSKQNSNQNLKDVYLILSKKPFRNTFRNLFFWTNRLQFTKVNIN